MGSRALRATRDKAPALSVGRVGRRVDQPVLGPRLPRLIQSTNSAGPRRDTDPSRVNVPGRSVYQCKRDDRWLEINGKVCGPTGTEDAGPLPIKAVILVETIRTWRDID